MAIPGHHANFEDRFRREKSFRVYGKAVSSIGKGDAYLATLAADAHFLSFRIKLLEAEKGLLVVQNDAFRTMIDALEIPNSDTLAPATESIIISLSKKGFQKDLDDAKNKLLRTFEEIGRAEIELRKISNTQAQSLFLAFAKYA